MQGGTCKSLSSIVYCLVDRCTCARFVSGTTAGENNLSCEPFLISACPGGHFARFISPEIAVFGLPQRRLG
jgi:hypothetical protein